MHETLPSLATILGIALGRKFLTTDYALTTLRREWSTIAHV